jgi:hypothetical protein
MVIASYPQNRSLSTSSTSTRLNGTSRPNAHSFVGFRLGEEMENAWNDIDHCSHITAGWRAPKLGLFKGVGLLSGWWARHHSDHCYYFGPDGSSITTITRSRVGEGAEFLLFLRAPSKMKRIAIAIADGGFEYGMIFEVFYPESVPVPPLSTGDELAVLLGDRSEVPLAVMAVEDSRAIVRMQNLEEWQVEGLQVGEIPNHLKGSDRNNYWRVGDRVARSPNRKIKA